VDRYGVRVQDLNRAFAAEASPGHEPYLAAVPSAVFAGRAALVTHFASKGNLAKVGNEAKLRGVRTPLKD
jgi:hypothetical protein